MEKEELLDSAMDVDVEKDKEFSWDSILDDDDDHWNDDDDDTKLQQFHKLITTVTSCMYQEFFKV